MKKAEHLAHSQEATADIVNAKRHTTQKLNKVDNANDRLRKLLESNGITLKIHIATSGGHKNAR